MKAADAPQAFWSESYQIFMDRMISVAHNPAIADIRAQLDGYRQAGLVADRVTWLVEELDRRRIVYLPSVQPLHAQGGFLLTWYSQPNTRHVTLKVMADGPVCLDAIDDASADDEGEHGDWPAYLPSELDALAGRLRTLLDSP